MRRLITLAAVLGLLAAACGSDEDATATLPEEGNTIILQTAYEGGFAPVEFVLNQMPQHTLYADGRMVSQGPQTAAFPGPMLPSMQQVNIGDAAMADVLAIVEEIGLPEVTDEYNTEAISVVADASDGVAYYYDDAGTHRYAVYALGIVESEEARVDATRRLFETLDTLAVESPPAGEYVPDRIQVLATQSFVDANEPEATLEPWPLAAAPADLTEVANFGVSCTVLEGEEATAALAVFAEADQMTFWDDEGVSYRILARPLFDNEVGCEW
jgi:hypothetical protein